MTCTPSSCSLRYRLPHFLRGFRSYAHPLGYLLGLQEGLKLARFICLLHERLAGRGRTDIARYPRCPPQNELISSSFFLRVKLKSCEGNSHAITPRQTGRSYTPTPRNTLIPSLLASAFLHGMLGPGTAPPLRMHLTKITRIT